MEKTTKSKERDLIKSYREEWRWWRITVRWQGSPAPKRDKEFSISTDLGKVRGVTFMYMTLSGSRVLQISFL